MEAGDATGLGQLVQLSPFTGESHWKLLAPEAGIATDCPRQMVVSAGKMISGSGWMRISFCVKPLQPVEFVTVNRTLKSPDARYCCAVGFWRSDVCPFAKSQNQRRLELSFGIVASDPLKVSVPSWQTAKSPWMPPFGERTIFTLLGRVMVSKHPSVVPTLSLTGYDPGAV